MNLVAVLSKVFYWPICRAYARHLGNKPADALLRCSCVPQFWLSHRYWPEFENPKTFSEKIWHRMLCNRDPLLTLVSDKFRVRDYIAQKGGSDYLIPLLWYGDNPENIPFEDLPNKFVIKANHGCGYNIIVQNKTLMDIPQIKNQLRKWLNENFCQEKGLGITWAYKNITPTIMIESFLDNNGQVPEDYKFFCYSGRAEFIQVSYDRFGDASERIVTCDFEPLELYNGQKLYPGQVVSPDNYKDMLRIAESLAHGFDFIRVDLYSVGGRIYFGELTCYPAGGLARFIPKKYDFVFGEKWKVK